MISDKINLFKNTFYQRIDDAQWSDWQWQLANMIKSFSDFKRIFAISDNDASNFAQNKRLPIGVTPFMAAVMYNGGENAVLQKLHIPHSYENILSEGELDDPLGEENDMKTPGLVHKYPDRVLFLVTSNCGAYCRYCTRSRSVGQRHMSNRESWQKALDYISEHQEIRDVLVSGGDPLVLPDDDLDWILSRIRAIKHVEIIRIGTRAVITMPMRITNNLLAIFKKYNPLFFSLHFSHYLELVPEVVEACDKLADNGNVMGSQTVLLKGVNDDTEVIKELMHKLLKCRVKPYYLFACDPVKGSYPFRCKIEKGLEIINSLRGHTSGYAVPTFAIDTPGGGKVVISPDNVEKKEEKYLVVKNYEGKAFKFPNY
ncbi:MAG: KamA family radical SAM protein [Alphaproteobacteria bacterium]